MHEVSCMLVYVYIYACMFVCMCVSEKDSDQMNLLYATVCVYIFETYIYIMGVEYGK